MSNDSNRVAAATTRWKIDSLVLINLTVILGELLIVILAKMAPKKNYFESCGRNKAFNVVRHICGFTKS
jgi:hypothetical protein